MGKIERLITMTLSRISTAALLLLFGSETAAFVAQSNPSSKNVLKSSVTDELSELKEIAAKANPSIKFYDPLNLSGANFFQDDESTIGFIRHAEIKHGRVAMAAFVGYLLQSNGVRFPWAMELDGTSFPSAELSPPEQWDALPDAGKWQIILAVGFLEVYDEMTGTHYMKGGVPGKFENFSENKDKTPHTIPLNLYDPLGLTRRWGEKYGADATKKEERLIMELNNGRLAMLGIMSFLAEQTVDGSVPFIHGLVPHYEGQVMAPFTKVLGLFVTREQSAASAVSAAASAVSDVASSVSDAASELASTAASELASELATTAAEAL